MSQACSINRCREEAQYQNVALCFDHMTPHVKALNKRRTRSPFKTPRPGSRREMKFNNTFWFWFRGYWRPEVQL